MDANGKTSDGVSKPVTGVFEADPRKGGWLRSQSTHFRPMPDDPVVPRQMAERWGLRGGEQISGRVASAAPKAPVLLEITSVDDRDREQDDGRKPFEDLVPIDPCVQIRFETPNGPPAMRIIDLLTPIGFGQRGLIVAPPRTGKTILLQQLAHGVAHNHPEAMLMMLLVDERPEEVTHMQRSVRGDVMASSNDQDIDSHIRLARLVNQRAKRLVEEGKDVAILMDSLTRLGRAFNNALRGTGRIMSGGLDAGALMEPKGIFGAARKIEHGGSLTIIATALIETGSRMDEVIFNEFKGTGNMEIMLSREMANRRLWPAIDLKSSGTRKEERLLTPRALAASYQIRRSLMAETPERGMEKLLDVMAKFPTNEQLIAKLLEAPRR